jgi:hypothetical protein
MKNEKIDFTKDSEYIRIYGKKKKDLKSVQSSQQSPFVSTGSLRKNIQGKQ